jgi:hypothetical protein
MIVSIHRPGAGRQVEIIAEKIDENDVAVRLHSGEIKAWVRKSLLRQTAGGNWTMPETVAKSKQFKW